MDFSHRLLLNKSGLKKVGKMTAAATTGPAQEPRPTSSTPQTYLRPLVQRLLSSLRLGSFIAESRLHEKRTPRPEIHPEGVDQRQAHLPGWARCPISVCYVNTHFMVGGGYLQTIRRSSYKMWILMGIMALSLLRKLFGKPLY